jgi:PAS domain S-box-containing protein
MPVKPLKTVREQEFEQLEERYRLMVEETRDYAIFMLDPQGRVTTWNIGAERIKGYAAEEVIGKHFSQFYTPEDVKLHKPDLMLSRALRDGRSENEGWRIRKDGSRFWANGILTALYDSAGRHTGFGKITRDLTERKKAEDALLKQEMELAQTRKLEAIGQLAGGVAHDFNNILTGIIGVIQEVMSTMPGDDKRLEDLQLVLDAGQRAFDLTKQLLAFGRRQIVQPQVLDVNKVVREFSKLVRRLISEDITLKFDLGAVRPVNIDPGQLDQVLLNLIVNARDAVRKGGSIEVRTGIQSLPAQKENRLFGAGGGEYVFLEVRDNGSGMDERTLTRIFEPFFTTKVRGQGTGLGLATIYGIVRQAGGDIQVISAPGQGSAFRIYLPVVDLALTEIKQSTSEKGNFLDGICVLVVEDESIVRQVIGWKLKRLGCRVLQADSGEAALRLIRTIPKIEIILTDVIMPGINGKDLVEAARKIRPEIRAVYMSGYPEDLIARKDVLVGNTRYLEKSDLDEKLESTLKSVLSD